MKYNFKILSFLLYTLTFLVQDSHAQTFPVQINTQLVPPYSGYLPDYADPSAEKLKIILQFNDFTQAQYNVKLRFEIKGNGFTISSKTFYNPPPITVYPGQPLLLSSADIAPYLNSNNLDFIGINQTQYQQRMALPEGYYSICVTAYDYYNSNPIQISNQACSQAWFTLSDPPFLNLPVCNTVLTPLTPQNVLFQWTPINLGSPNSALSTEYEFALYEIRPDSSANPNQIVLSTAPIFSTTTQQTFFNYGITEPPLNLYMKYVWRVRVKDNSGRDWFKNQGYSQICTFTYGSVANVLGNTINLNLTAEGISHRSGRCVFTKQSLYSNYLLQVRKEGTVNWFNYPNNTGTELIPNLEPNTTYECRVRGEEPITGNWSNTAGFTTLSPPTYACNNSTQPYNINLLPLPLDKAITGLVIQSGQFEVVATQIQANGLPGWYKGKGYALIFGALPVAVKWDNIFIDIEQRQQQGVIEAYTKGVDAWLNQYDLELAQENATYVDGTIDSVYVNNNQVCYTLQGNTAPICAPTPTGVNTMVIRDGEGNQYVVNLIPPPPKVTGPTNYLTISTDNLAAGDNLKVEFEASAAQNFGFDKKEYAAFISNYETIKLDNGKNYFVPNKSVGAGSTDQVIATYTISNFNAAQLSFKTQSGTNLSVTQTGNQFKITDIPSTASCIYAWYNNQKIGKLNIIELKAFAKKLVIVPVNNANLTITAQEINQIFKQANVTFSLSTASNFTFNLGNDGLEAADAKLLAKYSSEMRALREAYKTANTNYDADAYYIFVVPNFSNPQLQGYMVRGRALGFLKSNCTAKEIAHELAHGAFGLEHTFPAAKESSTSNLMDYGNGAQLIKVQWESIQNPGVILSWNDSEEDASLAQSEYFAKYMPNLNNPLIGDGLVPKALWDNNVAATSGLSTVCGLVDAVAEDISSLSDVLKFFYCWNQALTNDPECIAYREQTLQTGGFIITLMKCTSPLMFTDNKTCDPINIGIFNEIKKYGAATTNLTLPESQYLGGKLLYWVGGCFVGLTELKAGITSMKVAAGLKKLALALPKIKTIIGAFNKAGRSIKKTASGIALYFTLNTAEIPFATINNVDKLLKVQVPVYAPSTGANVIETLSYDAIKIGNQTYTNKTVEIINDNGVLKCRVVNGAGRFIANSGSELKTFLNNIITNPIGKTYNGKFYKSVSKNAELNHNAKPDIISQYSIDEAWGRYDLQSESAMYYSKTFNGNQTEMSHYGDWNAYSTYEFNNVQIDNMLDLTDDIIRQSLGTEFDKLVLGMSNKTQAYEFTNVIGTWARTKGYKGLIVPGARGAKDYSNVIVFNQSELTSVLNSITPIKLK